MRSVSTRPIAIRARRCSSPIAAAWRIFAVDPELVFVTTRLAGPSDAAVPAVQAARPVRRSRQSAPRRPTGVGLRHGLSLGRRRGPLRQAMLDLIRQFIHEVEEGTSAEAKTGVRFLIFPRYQQLDCVRGLVVADARTRGAWAALLDPAFGRQRQDLHHRLQAGSSPDHPARRVGPAGVRLDRGHHRPARARPPVAGERCVSSSRSPLGVVENIDKTSRQLKEALEGGKTIIVTTLQKFPVIAREIGELPGKRFALIVDEAHSSQSGESSKSLNAVLSDRSPEEAAAAEEGRA